MPSKRLKEVFESLDTLFGGECTFTYLSADLDGRVSAHSELPIIHELTNTWYTPFKWSFNLADIPVDWGDLVYWVHRCVSRESVMQESIKKDNA